MGYPPFADGTTLALKLHAIDDDQAFWSDHTPEATKKAIAKALAKAQELGLLDGQDEASEGAE